MKSTKMIFENGTWEIDWVVAHPGPKERMRVTNGMRTQWPIFVEGQVLWDHPESIPKYIKEIVYKEFIAKRRKKR